MVVTNLSFGQRLSYLGDRGGFSRMKSMCLKSQHFVMRQQQLEDGVDQTAFMVGYAIFTGSWHGSSPTVIVCNFFLFRITARRRQIYTVFPELEDVMHNPSNTVWAYGIFDRH